MKRPIFYFEKFRPWDIWTIVIYAIISIAVFFNLTKNILSNYTILTCVFIYLFNYKSLRNLSVYLIWLLFGVGQLVGYLYLKEDNSLLMPQGGSAALGLRNIFILLIVFQLLRVISLNIQNQEFVAPTRGGAIDIFEERRVSWLDYLLFAIYMACAFGLIFLGK